MRVCLNGKLMDDAEAHIAPGDRGLLLGDGIFETIAVRKGQGKRLHAHLERLRRDGHAIGLDVPWPDTTLNALIERVAQENNLDDAVVRLTVTRGAGPRGLLPPATPNPTLLITAAPMPDLSTPISVVVSTITRRNEHSPLSFIKSTNYLDNVLARKDAAELGADDAVLLNTQERVAETTIANIFALIDGAIITPPVEEGALPGVMRADVLKLARGEEKPITVEMLKGASEVFTSNALGLRSVIAIDGVAVSDGEPGLITQMLAARL
ncbi:MAG: aminotransferase class IV [Rhodospirillaceae bacterium]|nr:aminotransferase class IV [Rhodospirillaceae bacterium]